MRRIHNDLDIFLLIAIGWIGILSIIFEVFALQSTTILTASSNVSNVTFPWGIKAFTPPVTLSDYNHGLIFSSLFLFSFGWFAIIRNGYHPRRKLLFLHLQAIYFICQVLGFIVFGLFPVPAALMALLAGGAIYNLGVSKLECLNT